MKTIRVLCSFVIELEMSDEDYERRHFIIEDNGCPGTGEIGAKIEKMIETSHEEGICWACKAEGVNRIVSDDTCRHVEMSK